eukprot:gnl/TRDRNA2_/TRDRNA2_36303_c0_seq1.p1 gnl/TRDRNA2_/TRDRNA2_36303_c0~~gnl/TRDRNA2_/TRDRNA2_36303_c0_seq1.p1  ORF type:complete len:242 (+),score=41.19 gnl/TRDRNA2_/TRDRNA2_36303_c0_seq1:179-904(+)
MAASARWSPLSGAAKEDDDGTAAAVRDTDELAGTGGPSSSGIEAVRPSGGPKLPLMHTWCLWVLLPVNSAKDNWQNSQMNVHTFSSVEAFWRLFNNIRSPSKLGIIDFSVFKKDIAPAWEDETCKNGGRWIAKIEKARPEDFDELWLNLVLTIIGENFEDIGGRAVCGAVCSSRVRGASKVALWLSEKEGDKVMPIGRAFYGLLQSTCAFTGEIAFEDFSNGSKASFTLNSKETINGVPAA